MRSLLTFLACFSLTCAAHAEDGGGVEAGIMFSLEPDATKKHYNIRIMPHGKIVTHPSSSSTVEVIPKVSFVMGDDGKFKRIDIEVGQKYKFGMADIGTAPRVIIGENGASWLVVPRSYWFKVNGVGPDVITTLPGQVRAIVSSLGSSEPVKENQAEKPGPLIMYSPTKDPDDCPEIVAITSPLSGTPQLEKVNKLQLTYPQIKPSLSRKEEEHVLTLKAKWATCEKSDPSCQSKPQQ